MVIVGEKNIFTFDPGGHGLRYNKAASSHANTVITNFSQGMNQAEDTFKICLVAIKPLSEYWRIIESPAEENEVFYDSDWDTKGFRSRIPMVLLDKTFTNLEDLYMKSIGNLENLPRLSDSMLAFKSGDMSGIPTPWRYTGV